MCRYVCDLVFKLIAMYNNRHILRFAEHDVNLAKKASIDIILTRTVQQRSYT
ncbi:hypothetical protein SHLI107390_12320 [Shewanella livingstonensis]